MYELDRIYSGLIAQPSIKDSAPEVHKTKSKKALIKDRNKKEEIKL